MTDPAIAEPATLEPSRAVPVRRRLARRLIAASVVVLLVALAAIAWVAWHFSGLALDTSRTVILDSVAAPDGPGRVSLPADRFAALPGRYGLAWEGGYGELGEVLAQGSDTIVRRFAATTGSLAETLPARIDPFAFAGDPRTARGLEFSEVQVAGELGDMPAWYVPASPGGSADRGRTWVVFVHGRGADRREALRYLPAWHGAGLPSLVISYRNDLGAPASPDGHTHFGDQEWRDVEAAVRYALDAGARDVVLAGWSMGGAVSLQMVDRSEAATSVRGLILDSPVMDWRDVFVFQGGEEGLPSPISRLAIWTTERRIGVDLDRFDWVARSEELSKPILLFAPDGDSYVPNAPALRVAAARPDLVELVNDRDADHVRSWNVDPEGYEATMQAWLVKTGAAQPVSAVAG